MRVFFKICAVLTLSLIGSFCTNGPSDTNQKVENIETFTRLYGYARWFHPSDEAQEIDWEKLAVLGIQKVENIKSTKELRDTLYQLFSPIVQGLQIYKTDKPEKFNSAILLLPDENAQSVAWQHYGVYLSANSNIYQSTRLYKKKFDRKPQFGEIIHEPIGNNLTCIVPLVLLTKDSVTYPKAETASLVRLKSEIDNTIINNEFNMQASLAGVVIAWNVLQHFFPYFDVIDTDWNSVLSETLKSTLENKRKTDYFITMSRMFATLDDGHGIIFGESMYHLPTKVDFIENEIVITASKDSLLKKGDVIKQMDYIPVMSALNVKEKMISGSPQLRRYRALNNLGGKFYPSDTQILIERNGEEQMFTVPNSSSRSMFFNQIDDRKYSIEKIIEIEPGIYYINMANSTEKDFYRNIDVLANAKAVIYDQRGGISLSFFKIVPHLIKKPVTSACWNVPLTIYPNRKQVEFQKSNWNMQPEQPLFKSKTIIINVPSVVSSGETMMGIIDHYNLGTTVGETTAGCNGNVNIIKLPYGYSAWFTGMKVLKHDGSQLYMKGFQPDYPVTRTIQAIKEGRDEYLEKALEIAKSK